MHFHQFLAYLPNDKPHQKQYIWYNVIHPHPSLNYPLRRAVSDHCSSRLPVPAHPSSGAYGRHLPGPREPACGPPRGLLSLPKAAQYDRLIPGASIPDRAPDIIHACRIQTNREHMERPLHFIGTLLFWRPSRRTPSPTQTHLSIEMRSKKPTSETAGSSSRIHKAV